MDNTSTDDVSNTFIKNKVKAPTGTLLSFDETLTDTDEGSITCSDTDTVNKSHSQTETDDESEKGNTSKQWEKEMETLLKQIETIVQTLKIDEDWTGGGLTYKGKIEGCLVQIDKAFFKISEGNAPLDCVKQFRCETAKMMMESDIVAKLCSAVSDIYQKQLENSIFEINIRLFRVFRIVISIVWNYTDASTDFAVQVANIPGFLEFIRKVLNDSAEKHISNSEKDDFKEDLLDSCIAIVHNISLVDGNITRLRDLKFTEVLQQYLKSSNEEIHLSALVGLAAIIDEKESEIIQQNEESVKLLMERLREGLQDEHHLHLGWACREYAIAIRTLARNDANKKLLVQLGALELLVELSKGDIEEQTEAVGALWALSFDEDNRRALAYDDKLGIVAILNNLKNSNTMAVKKAANGILWNLREFVQDSSKKTVTEHAKEGHIMISYQWSHQTTLLKIKEELVKNGFKVWMDVEQMIGSTVQAMAEAVENADIVLICLSNKYKHSENCRQEAEYSYQLKKKIVPLKLERGYKADGWLGFIAGAKKYYEFSGHRPFESELNDLIMCLRRIKKELQPEIMEPSRPVQAPDIVDGPAVHGSLATPLTKQVSAINIVRQWKPDDLKNWIRKHDLPVEKFEEISADDIALLMKMKSEAPESFYRYLQAQWNLDLKIWSKLVWALEDIG